MKHHYPHVSRRALPAPLLSAVRALRLVHVLRPVRTPIRFVQVFLCLKLADFLSLLFSLFPAPSVAKLHDFLKVFVESSNFCGDVSNMRYFLVSPLSVHAKSMATLPRFSLLLVP